MIDDSGSCSCHGHFMTLSFNYCFQIVMFVVLYLDFINSSYIKCTLSKRHVRLATSVTKLNYIFFSISSFLVPLSF